MMEGVRGIDWELMEDAIPAFLCIVCIPYFFNIAYGAQASVAVLGPTRAWRLTRALPCSPAPPWRLRERWAAQFFPAEAAFYMHGR